MGKKITIIKTFIFIGYIGVPLSACFLFYFGSRTWGHIAFLIFMIAHSFERVWETFYTTKERKSDQLHGDWTLAVVTVAYLLLCFLTIWETNVMVQQFHFTVFLAGLILYAAAFRIRWWGMKSLGKQWAIHAVGAQKIKNIRLIKIGAFKYVRHPIYLAIMVEVISIPIIGNAFWSTIFAICVNAPLQFLRLVVEEKTSVRRFGAAYEQYQKEVDMLLPIKFFKKKISSKNVPG